MNRPAPLPGPSTVTRVKAAPEVAVIYRLSVTETRAPQQSLHASGPQFCMFSRLSGRSHRGMRVRAGDWRPSLAASMVIPGYTRSMKTAISLPDETYEQATRQAAELGISRSEFMARAARSYLDQLAAHSLTRQIDEALQATQDDSNADAAAAGRRFLAGQDDW